MIPIYNYNKTGRLLTTLAVAGFLVLLSWAQPLMAATYTVDTTTDDASLTGCSDTTDSDCSLRGAVIKVNNGTDSSNTITLPAGTYTLTLARTADTTEQENSHVRPRSDDPLPQSRILTVDSLAYGC